MNNSSNTSIARSKPAPWRCGNCKEKEMRPAVIRYASEATHDGRRYPIVVDNLSVFRCSNCGNTILPDESSRQITEQLRSQAGVLTPEQIREGLVALGLHQKDLANL